MAVSTQLPRGRGCRLVLCCITSTQPRVWRVEDVPCVQTDSHPSSPKIHCWFPGGRWNVTLLAISCVSTQTDVMTNLIIYIYILFRAKSLSIESDVCILFSLLQNQ